MPDDIPVVTDLDMQEMLRQNPLAKEQLLRIAAERREAELRDELKMLRNGGGEETNETPQQVVAESFADKQAQGLEG